MKLSLIISSIIGLALATPTPEVHTLSRREPSDKSGNSQFVLQCEGVTIPNQGGASGEGEGGLGYFYSNLLFDANGEKIQPVGCTESSSTCSNCLFSGGGLSSDTNVTGCWNPPAGQKGCSVTFSYNGYDYDSQASQPYCGHQSGFEAFSFDLSAVCYFDV